MTAVGNDTSSSFAHLTREQLEHRLRFAEDVCLLAGWTAHGDSVRDKALTELWMRWSRLVGSDYTGPQAHPELSGSIDSLARQRDATRAATLAHYFGPEES